MQKSIVVIFLIGVIAATMIASATVANSDVSATHKKGHHEPPACDNGSKNVEKKNKHCGDDHDNGDGNDGNNEDDHGEGGE